MSSIQIINIEKKRDGGLKIRFSNGENLTFGTKELMSEYISRSKEPEIIRGALSDLLSRDPNLLSTDDIKNVEYSLSEPTISRVEK